VIERAAKEMPAVSLLLNFIIGVDRRRMLLLRSKMLSTGTDDQIIFFDGIAGCSDDAWFPFGAFVGN
jgi:hypothetical protein